MLTDSVTHSGHAAQKSHVHFVCHACGWLAHAIAQALSSRLPVLFCVVLAASVVFTG